MKKVLLFSIISLAIFTTGCKKQKSNALNYNDSDPITMVLRGTHTINVESEYDITYDILDIDPNKRVLTMPSNGTLYGFNVGKDKVSISNGHESKTVDVIVNLFREPTFEFGCRPNRIAELFGTPYDAGYQNDTILIYQYTQTPGYNGNYSYACGELDFYFYNGRYFEADVFIIPNATDLMNSYLNENFIIDTALCNDTLQMFRNKIDRDIICGKYNPHNQYNEWRLFYVRDNQSTSFANVLKTRPRSSKLRY